MKNLFTLTAILVTQLIFSQDIGITPEQKQRIKDLCTPENLIEWSKAVSNEKRLDSTLQVRNDEIRLLKNLSEAAYKENIRYKKERDSIDKVILEKSNLALSKSEEQLSVIKDQLKKEKLKILKIGGIGLLSIVAVLVIK